MSKAFVKESGDDADALDDEQSDQSAGIPPGSKNYVTAEGHRAMRESLLKLMSVERPEVVRVVSWAASNGDRSENGDYIYGKRRLREIDRRIRYLSKRLDCAEVVDPSMHLGNDQIFFGAKVEFFRNGEGPESITIVGIDEVDSAPRRVSWVSPIARALIKARVGDLVMLKTPQGLDEIEILAVDYAWSMQMLQG